MFLLIVLAFALGVTDAQYTRSFLRGLKKYQDDYKLNQFINGVVSHVENKVLTAAKEGKTYYTEPFYGCDMYGDPFLQKNCDVITEEVKLKVQKLFPECDLAYDARTNRYILSWM
jgi:hypothetical protein